MAHKPEGFDELPAPKRATWRIEAITGPGTYYNDGEPDTDVKDLLTDILHYCDAYNIDFESLLSGAVGMHDDEVLEP